jgi:hypothetical protein
VVYCPGCPSSNRAVLCNSPFERGAGVLSEKVHRLPLPVLWQLTCYFLSAPRKVCIRFFDPTSRIAGSDCVDLCGYALLHFSFSKKRAAASLFFIKRKKDISSGAAHSSASQLGLSVLSVSAVYRYRYSNCILILIRILPVEGPRPWDRGH